MIGRALNLRMDHVMRGKLRARIFDAYTAALKDNHKQMLVNLSADQLLVMASLVADEDVRIAAMLQPVRWRRYWDLTLALAAALLLAWQLFN